MLTRRTIALGPVMAIALATAVVNATTAAAGASLRIDPSDVAVSKDQTFAVQVVQDAPVATSGAQASVDFDPTILQVVSVSAGSAYAAAPIFEPPDLTTDIRNANTIGHLAQIAAAFVPPGSVPQGTASFLVIRFRAVGCGQTDLKLPSGPLNAQMISAGQGEAYGQPVPVVTTKGHVTTCVAQDAVSAGLVADGTSGSGNLPWGWGLVGAAALSAAGLLGWLAWRSRRHGQLDDVAR